MSYVDDGVVIAVVIGLTQAAKTAGLSSRLAPLLAITLGVACTLLFAFEPNSVLKGIVLGLTAAGLYSGTKATVS